MGVILSSTNWLTELSLTIALIGNMQFDVLLFRVFNIIPCTINFITNWYTGGFYFDNFCIALVIILVNGGYIIYYIILRIIYLNDEKSQEIYDKYFKESGISVLKFRSFMKLGQKYTKLKCQSLKDIACSSEIFDIVYLFINDEKSNHYLSYIDKKTEYKDQNRDKIAWVGFSELFYSVVKKIDDDSTMPINYFGDYSYECEEHFNECSVDYYKFDVKKLLKFIKKDKDFKCAFLSVFEREISFMLTRMKQEYLKENKMIQDEKNEQSRKKAGEEYSEEDYKIKLQGQKDPSLQTMQEWEVMQLGQNSGNRNTIVAKSIVKNSNKGKPKYFKKYNKN